MTGQPATAAAAAAVPEGFFDEIAAMLHTETATEIAEAVITVCTRRGILHPELTEDPADELFAEEIREVFNLLDAVTLAVSDGTIVPRGITAAIAGSCESMDPDLAAAWHAFVDDAADPEATAATSKMLTDGALALTGSASRAVNRSRSRGKFSR